MSVQRALYAMFPPTNTHDGFDLTAKPNDDQSNVASLNKAAINVNKNITLGFFFFFFYYFSSFK